jgi:ferric-dicitrate binding protein FerR (iron transport regulator)
MDASERRKRASSEAADWFARLQAGEMERAERQQFVEWLRESYIHVTEMLRIAQIHGELKQFECWARISTGPKTDDDNVVQLPTAPDEGSQDPHLHPPRPPPVRLSSRWGHGSRLFAAAAAVVVIVTTAVVLPKIRGQVIETARGERREVVLSDGSVLQVDPETRLRVKYADEVRRVFLERGRALFRVAKNPSRPFLVQADDTTVRAVGTAFGVEQQRHGVVVTVAEGKVAVSSPGFQPPSPTVGEGRDPHSGRGEVTPEQEGEASSPSTSDEEGQGVRNAKRGGENIDPSFWPSPSEVEGGSKSRIRIKEGPGERVSESTPSSPGTLFLTADQQVTVPSSGAAEPVREVDSHRALAWAEGRLIFQNDELGKVIAEFNHYNRVQLTVADPALAAKPVSGVFNASDPEAFIAILQSVTTVQIVRDGNRSITIGTAPRP